MENHPFNFDKFDKLPNELRDIVYSFLPSHPTAKMIKNYKTDLVNKFYIDIISANYKYFNKEHAFLDYLYIQYKLYSFELYTEYKYEYEGYDDYDEYENFENNQYFNRETNYFPFIQYQLRKAMDDKFFSLSTLFEATFQHKRIITKYNKR